MHDCTLRCGTCHSQLTARLGDGCFERCHPVDQGVLRLHVEVEIGVCLDEHDLLLAREARRDNLKCRGAGERDLIALVSLTTLGWKNHKTQLICARKTATEKRKQQTQPRMSKQKKNAGALQKHNDSEGLVQKVVRHRGNYYSSRRGVDVDSILHQPPLGQLTGMNTTQETMHASLI